MSVQTIETMAKWVVNNVTENPTLEDMSAHVGYSPFYCSVKFREHMGMTYKQFLAQCRVSAAANDLRNTDDKITDIAFRYGYSSSESLARAFATIFKCSPRQYRKNICKCKDQICLENLEETTPAGVAASVNIKNVTP